MWISVKFFVPLHFLGSLWRVKTRRTGMEAAIMAAADSAALHAVMSTPLSEILLAWDTTIIQGGLTGEIVRIELPNIE